MLLRIPSRIYTSFSLPSLPAYFLPPPTAFSSLCQMLRGFFSILPLVLLFPICRTVNADPSVGSGSALEPPGLRPLVARANALFSAGQYNDAVKTFSSAIGNDRPPMPHRYHLCILSSSSTHVFLSQSCLLRTISFFINEERRISLLVAILPPSPTSTRSFP